MRSFGFVFAMLLIGVCVFGCKRSIPNSGYDQTLELKLDPASLESGSTAQITAQVTQDMMPKPGVKVTFSASGNCGTLSATSATSTPDDGRATVTFKGISPYSTCSAMITATAKTTQTSMITVTPQGVTRTAPDSSVPAGEDAPSVVVTPDVTLPVSNGFSATYSITATNASIDSIHIVSSQKAQFSTSNGATPPEGSTPDNPAEVTLNEPASGSYNSDVITITSDSLKLGKLMLTVTLKNPFGGNPIILRFTDPATNAGALPGPG